MALDGSISVPECTEAFTRSILDEIAGPHFLLDQGMRIVALNSDASQLFAWHQDDAEGQPFSHLFSSTDVQQAAGTLLSQPSWRAEGQTRSGVSMAVEFTRSVVQSTLGLRYLVSVRKLDTPLGSAEQRPAPATAAKTTLDAVSDAVVETDATGVVTFSNRAARLLLRCSGEDLQGKRLVELLRFRNPHHNDQLEAAAYQVLQSGGTLHFNESAELLRTETDTVCIEGKLLALCDRHGVINGCAAIMRDLSTERRMQAVLSFKASHDELTGLINRREFEHRLHELILRGGSAKEANSVLIIDLDRFKLVNDSHGHIAGDLLLRQFAETLLTGIRGNDTLARTGGDRFAVLLPGCNGERARKIADSLHGIATAFRFAWQDKQIQLGVSIGVVTIDQEMFGPGDVVTAADAALLVAKENGRNRIVVYQSQGPEERRRRGEVLWANRIRDALDRDRLRLYCQPIVPLNPAGKGGWSCEVLVRMLDDRDELIPPMAFIPAAERYDLMPLVDRWVIEAVIKHWQSRRGIFDRIEKCNINLSGQSLAQEGFLELILNAFDNSGFPPAMACFEITETAVVANMTNAQRLIRELSARGCRFALDDFGSGLSSFTYLKHLPVDYLKIDGSFVRDMLSEPIDAAMVRAIADIGHTLGLKTIAEFVENDALIAALAGAGVDYAQGFGVQRPFPLSELSGYLPQQLGS
jgi:diguanylate cyclase (GGDEF)-like protein